MAVAWRLYPHPQDLEIEEIRLASSEAFPRAYWIYLCGSALVALGYADYPLLAFHFTEAATVSLAWIPALYALAMGVDAIAALVFGRWFDRVGLNVLLVATVLSAGFAPLGFGTRREFAVLGTVLWGIGMGAQESIMRAAIANMTTPTRRATAYGVFNLAYGVAWFAGSAFMGWIYMRSLAALDEVGLRGWRKTGEYRGRPRGRTNAWFDGCNEDPLTPGEGAARLVARPAATHIGRAFRVIAALGSISRLGRRSRETAESGFFLRL